MPPVCLLVSPSRQEKKRISSAWTRRAVEYAVCDALAFRTGAIATCRQHLALAQGPRSTHLPGDEPVNFEETQIEPRAMATNGPMLPTSWTNSTQCGRVRRYADATMGRMWLGASVGVKDPGPVRCASWCAEAGTMRRIRWTPPSARPPSAVTPESCIDASSFGHVLER